MGIRPDIISTISESERTGVYLASDPAGDPVIYKCVRGADRTGVYRRIAECGSDYFPGIVDIRYEDGNTYVIAFSGEDILKISADGVLEQRYSGKEYDFTGATHIAYGGDGNIYVHLVSYSEGVRIEKEQVISLSPDAVI